MEAMITICLALCLVVIPFGSNASAFGTSMSGDYVKDTSAVAQSLQQTIEMPNDQANRSEQKDETVKLITEYISRYRNRPQVNQSISFTTMQTALNAMAGHYKTFNRPLPESLKDRLTKELSKAEDLAIKGS